MRLPSIDIDFMINDSFIYDHEHVSMRIMIMIHLHVRARNHDCWLALGNNLSSAISSILVQA